MQDAVSKFQLESLRLPDDFSSPDKDSIHNSDIDKLTILMNHFPAAMPNHLMRTQNKIPELTTPILSGLNLNYLSFR